MQEYIASEAFSDWRKSREHETKLQLAIIDRLDGVIKSLQAVGKARR